MDRTTSLAGEAQAWLRERNIPPTPENFQLAFAYADGSNASLKHSIDALIAVGSTFDAAAMSTLHECYFSTAKAEQSIADFGEKIAGELNSVLSLLATASRDHSAYRQTLSTASGELQAGKLVDATAKLFVNQLINATRTMEARTQALETQLQASSQEVTELRQRLEATQRESRTDHLTGIANRKTFDTELSKSVQDAADSGEPISLVLFDIDKFKLFNDTWGHQTGDHVLRFVASCLAEHARVGDTAARYGGEEFGVILPKTRLEDAVAWANQVRARVGSKKLIKRSTGGSLGAITVSAGVTQLKANESIAQFVRRADTCLYAAKHAGRNRVVCEADSKILASAEIEAA